MLLQNLGLVIIGRNEGERLIRCLRSIGAYAESTVYVDSGSTDGSVSVAGAAGICVIRLDMTQPFTAARARNSGFAALLSLRPELQFVQFVDGDCELLEGWLEKASSFIAERPEVAVVCGRRRERNPDASIYNRLCDIEWDTPVGSALACGGDSLMRAAAFMEQGGFKNELMAGEEPELCMRLRERGWKIWRLGAEMTVHDASITRFDQWWARAVRSGYGYADVSRLHQDSHFTLYKKEMMRAILWGGILPFSIGIAAFVNPAALFGLLIYPLQICRIAFQRGATYSISWMYATFMVISKFPELKGIVHFFWNKLHGRIVRPIEYKK